MEGGDHWDSGEVRLGGAGIAGEPEAALLCSLQVAGTLLFCASAHLLMQGLSLVVCCC